MEGFRAGGVSVAVLLLSIFTATSSASHPRPTSGVTRYHKFVIAMTNVTRLCQTQRVATVNGRIPGPAIHLFTGDWLVIKVINMSPYNASIHWHGIRQFRNGWADGPEFVTQCPILPGKNYTYRFTVTNQVGTFWWHGHSSWLRSTVYGPLIIHPSHGTGYPYPHPDTDATVQLAEWWNANPMDVIQRAFNTGSLPNASDALTINSQPGDFSNCSANATVRIPVHRRGDTVRLRLINSAMNVDMFVAVANHNMTVVAVDALYTKPNSTNVVFLGPGQTTDVLVTANQSCGRYYVAAHAYITNPIAATTLSTTTAILDYSCANSSATPVNATLPGFNNTAVAERFETSLRSLNSRRYPSTVPKNIDNNLFSTISLNFLACKPNNGSCPSSGQLLSTSLNNFSFALPTTTSVLQARYYNISGVYTADFPDSPLSTFNYTSTNLSNLQEFTRKATKVKLLKYNSTVQLVLQGTGMLGGESHPMHLHGYDFYVVGRGLGNFNASSDPANFNLVDPVWRNTVNVPANGWVVIRFVADNPGAWFFHCHLDLHVVLGLATVFIVENGPTYQTSIMRPPKDLPQC